MSIKSDKALELFKSGYNCSQSVLAVFCEKYGLPLETAMKTACGFGGGMRCGEICGAATGATMAIGLRYGQYITEDKESKSKCYAETVKFTDEFKKRNGSIICRKILGSDISTKEGMEIAQNINLFKTVCYNMVTSAVNILEEMGY